MANLNKVFLMGNLTRDPQLRYLPNQTAVVDFGLAVNRKWRDQSGQDREDVLFVDCTAWAKQAETINQYCQKGKGLFIEGRLKLDTWEDKQGGGKRSKITVVVENFQFIGGRPDNAGGPNQGGAPEESSQRPNQAAPAGRAPVAPQSSDNATPPISEEQHFTGSEIPF